MSELPPASQAKYIGWQGAFYNFAKLVAPGGLVWLAGVALRRLLGRRRVFLRRLCSFVDGRSVAPVRRASSLWVFTISARFASGGSAAGGPVGPA